MLIEALNTMESGKSPGTDSLPAEFYKDVSPFLIRCLNKNHQKGKLALSQRRSIISLIPKKDRALQEPLLTLLNGHLLKKKTIIGFGSSLIKRINLFHCDIQSCVINNSWSVGFFELRCKAGVSAIALHFILCTEALATTICKDNEVKGITIGSIDVSSVNRQMTPL